MIGDQHVRLDQQDVEGLLVLHVGEVQHTVFLPQFTLLEFSVPGELGVLGRELPFASDIAAGALVLDLDDPGAQFGKVHTYGRASENGSGFDHEEVFEHEAKVGGMWIWAVRDGSPSHAVISAQDWTSRIVTTCRVG